MSAAPCVIITAPTCWSWAAPAWRATAPISRKPSRSRSSSRPRPRWQWRSAASASPGDGADRTELAARFCRHPHCRAPFADHSPAAEPRPSALIYVRGVIPHAIFRAMVRQSADHRLRGAQIGGLEALCEPLIYRCENLSRIVLAILVYPQPGEAGGARQLPGQGPLASRPVEPLLVMVLCPSLGF